MTLIVSKINGKDVDPFKRMIRALEEVTAERRKIADELAEAGYSAAATYLLGQRKDQLSK